MYLGHRKIKARGYDSGFKQQEIPKPLDQTQLQALVAKLRSGDKTVEEQIILAHLGLTIQIVGRYVNFFPRKSDDLIGVATVALVEAVNRFQYNATNDLITPYIVSCVHGQLSNYLKQDQTIRMTQHGFQKHKNNMPIMFSISAINEDEDKHLHELIIRALRSFDYHESAIEVEEVIRKLNFTRFEALVYRKLCDNMSEAEIGRELGYSRSRIYLVRREIAAKLRPFFFDHPKEKSAHV